jgi:hypothetical protein
MHAIVVCYTHVTGVCKVTVTDYDMRNLMMSMPVKISALL